MKIHLILILSLIQYFSIVYTRSIDKTSFNAIDNKYYQQNVYAEVTYPGIGHFTTKDFYDPKYRPIVFLPQSPEHIKTKFLLHTRQNLKDAQVLKQGDQNAIKSSHFNGKNPTKFIVHGFLDNQLFGDWMRTMKDEFLMEGDYNVIIVDWSCGNGLPYGQATANTRVVGPVMSLFINDLKAVSGLELSNVHILGHSLGSHIAGYAGEKQNGQLGRISGLDPAGPYYEGLPPAAKLDPTDAQFVDAIHTDARHLIPDLGFGMYETSGHLDFYPNGGRDQPGCDQQRWTSIFTDGLAEGVRRLVACNHQRAVDFYMTSINHKYTKGVGYQCSDYETFQNGKCVDCGPNGDKCAILGQDAQLSKKVEKSTRGTRFFMRTTDKYPYFKHEYEIQIKLSAPTAHTSDSHGVLTVTLHGANSDEKIQLNPKDQIFHLGQTYTFMQNLDYNLGDIKSVTFKWHRTLGSIIHQKMWIDSITVVPLSSDNILNREQHLKEIKTLCTNNQKDGIQNEKDYQFSNNC